MSAVRTVTHCARCGNPETDHETRADGSPGKRLGTAPRADGTLCCGVACTGYQPGHVEQRPPEDELRRRLAVIEHEIHHAETPSGECVGCGHPSPCPSLRAARGEL